MTKKTFVLKNKAKKSWGSYHTKHTISYGASTQIMTFKIHIGMSFTSCYMPTSDGCCWNILHFGTYAEIHSSYIFMQSFPYVLPQNHPSQQVIWSHYLVEMQDLFQCVLGCTMQCTVGAHRVYVHSVSWIRHLGMACGEMFVVRCSHNLPATAELPFANRPGDRTDRFRSTCRNSLLVQLTIYCFLGLCCYILGWSGKKKRIFCPVYVLSWMCLGIYKMFI